MFSVGNLIIPAVAHELLKPGGEVSARKVSYRYALEGVALLAPVFLLVLFAPDTLMRTVYGHMSGYAEHDVLLRVMLLGACGLYVSHVLYCYFLGKKRVTIVAKSQLVASTAAVSCALLLIPVWGIAGAVASFVVLGVVRSSVLANALRLDSRRATRIDSYAAVEKA
jgi:O-antigen/teichoic acid export membrane protein